MLEQEPAGPARNGGDSSSFLGAGCGPDHGSLRTRFRQSSVTLGLYFEDATSTGNKAVSPLPATRAALHLLLVKGGRGCQPVQHALPLPHRRATSPHF